MNKRGGAAATQSIHRSRIRPVANKISAGFKKKKKKRKLTQNHQELHQDTACQKSIHIDVPHPTATFRSGNVHVEQLVLVLRPFSSASAPSQKKKKKKRAISSKKKKNLTYDDGRKPKDTTGTHSHQRRKGSVNQSNGSDEQQVDND